MKRVAWLVVLAAATWSACARSTPEQQMINDAAAALGGSDRIQAVKTLIIEGEGTNGNLGQDVRPDATSQTFNVTGYKRAVDVAAGRARIQPTIRMSAGFDSLRASRRRPTSTPPRICV